MMVAPCVRRLKQQISVASDPTQKALLAAELACYLARIGEIDEAQSIVKSLRVDYGRGEDGRVTVMLMCVEGLMSFFRDMGAGALERLTKAQFLSVTFQDRALISFASSWLALIYYNQDRFEECIDAIKTGVAAIEEGHVAAIARISLLLGDLFVYCGSSERSRSWYTRAHRAATHYGDQATIGALTYNRASLGVHMLRLKSVVHQITDAEVRTSEAEVRTAVNYQDLTATKSLQHLLTGSEIGVRMLNRDFRVAREKIRELLGSGEVPSDYKFRYTLMADLVLCASALSLEGELQEGVEQLKGCNLGDVSADDQVLICHSLMQAGQHDLCSKMFGGATLSDLLARHEATASKVRAALMELAAIPGKLQ